MGSRSKGGYRSPYNEVMAKASRREQKFPIPAKFLILPLNNRKRKRRRGRRNKWRSPQKST